MSAYQLQIAIYNALTELATPSLIADFAGDNYELYSARIEEALAFLNANVVGVYDNPAQVADPSDDSAFPFITISDSTLQPWDTDTERGADATVTIHTWSRARNALEVKQIQDAVYNVLHRGNLAIAGYTFIGSDYLTQTVQRDPDGITRHGVQDFKIVFEEA